MRSLNKATQRMAVSSLPAALRATADSFTNEVIRRIVILRMLSQHDHVTTMCSSERSKAIQSFFDCGLCYIIFQSIYSVQYLGASYTFPVVT